MYEVINRLQCQAIDSAQETHRRIHSSTLLSDSFHVHRVERLIHLELAAQRVRDLGQCPECGKEHREWLWDGGTLAGEDAEDDGV
jgi:hypothetical protein